MGRKIKLEQDEYDFPSNSALSAQWSGLRDASSLQMIGQILAYIEFHEYLIQNLRYKSRDGWQPLWLHVSEGLYKTAILHYVSIIELVLFTVVEQHYQSRRNGCPNAVIACFKRADLRHYEFSAKEVTVELNGCRLHSKLYAREQREAEVDARDVRLDMLIRAGVELRLYDKTFSERLSKLNDLRNGIHLKKQAQLRKKLAKDDPFQHVYTKEALDECKRCVETLQHKLASYRNKSPVC
jgi:hypothetical protein